jgi:hypothetical protein
MMADAIQENEPLTGVVGQNTPQDVEIAEGGVEGQNTRLKNR